MQEKGLEIHFERVGNLPLIVRLSSLLSSFSVKKPVFLPLPGKFSFFELLRPVSQPQCLLEHLNPTQSQRFCHLKSGDFSEIILDWLASGDFSEIILDWFGSGDFSEITLDRFESG
jgi:hypothetical protein